MKAYTSNSQVVIASICATIIVFIINGILPSFLNGFTSNINLDLSNLWESNWAESHFYDRYNHSEFGRRIFVLEFQRLAYSLGVPFQFSFNLINFGANFCFFYLSYKLASLYYRSINPWLFIFFLLINLPILFAYLPVIFTYDDTFQFVLLTGFFICFYRDKKFLGYLLFFMSCLARESSTLFGAFFIIYFWLESRQIKYVIKKLLPYLLIVIAYLLILYIRADREFLEASWEFLSQKRFSAYQENFISIWEFLEILFYIGAVYALVFWVLKQQVYDNEMKKIYAAFIFLVLVNLSICLLSTTATEARFYTMTLIPIFPLLGPGLNKTWNLLSNRSIFTFKNIMMAVIGSIILMILYRPGLHRGYYVFAAYLFLFYSFFFFLLTVQLKSKYKLRVIKNRF